MIWLNFAFRTENFFTPRASHSKLSLMFCCFFRKLLSIIIFFIIVDIPCLNLPNVPTSAKYDSWNICELGFVLYSIEFRSHYFSELEVPDLSLARFIRAVDLFVLWQVFSCYQFAAFIANYVRAFVNDYDLVHRHFIERLLTLYTLHANFLLHFLFESKPILLKLLVKSVFEQSCYQFYVSPCFISTLCPD